ncbi:uncharacterized protein LOC144477982, partial [Augochlora pura]
TTTEGNSSHIFSISISHHHWIRDCQFEDANPSILQAFSTPASTINTPQTPISSNASTPPVFANPQCHIKLPTLNLPSFDGAYDDWVRFRDTFESLIHANESLTNIQKFYYLNSALKDDAARTIQSLGLSDSNYILAWKTLKDRYNDSNALVQHHVRSLFDMLPVKRISYSNLRHVLDDFNNHLLALQSLNEPIFSCNSILVHLMLSKLDLATQREWEKQVMTFSGRPTWQQMAEFLESHCKYLERVAINKPSASFAPEKPTPVHYKREHHTNTVSYLARTADKCPLCSKAHLLYACDQFKELTIAARIDK